VQQMLLVLLKQGGWIWHYNYLQMIYITSISLSTSFAFTSWVRPVYEKGEWVARI
jgi:hypothetical protein